MWWSHIYRAFYLNSCKGPGYHFRNEHGPSGELWTTAHSHCDVNLWCWPMHTHAPFSRRTNAHPCSILKEDQWTPMLHPQGGPMHTHVPSSRRTKDIFSFFGHLVTFNSGIRRETLIPSLDVCGRCREEICIVRRSCSFRVSEMRRSVLLQHMGVMLSFVFIPRYLPTQLC